MTEETPDNSISDDVIYTTRFSASVKDGDNNNEDDREFTAEKLANWTTFIIEDNNNSGEGVMLKEKKRKGFVSVMEKRFQLEHRQRLYYGLWWLIVIAWNIPLHYFLWRPDRDKMIVLSANLLLTLLMRNEQVVWVFYIIGAGIAKRLPARGCLHMLKSYVNKMTVNIGGIHTGASFFLMFDWCWVIFEGIKNGAGGTPRETAHFFILTVSLVVLFLIVILAVPLWRHLQVHHDMFEFSHRFGGWTVAGLVLIDVVISLSQGGDEVYPLTAASVWMTVAAICVVIWPWVTFRPRVKATVFAPSDRVCILTWKGKPWYFSSGTAGKVATHPLGQYHSFALLPHIEGDKSLCIMAIAKAGDWTSAMIGRALYDHEIQSNNAVESDVNAATTKIALYRFARPGFMYLARTYKRVICVGTGAGIAPISAYLPEPPNEMLILWFGRKFEQTYGPLYHFVAGYRNSILIDTKAAPSEKNPYLPVYNLSFTQKSMRRPVAKLRTTIRYGGGRPDIPRLTKAAVEMFNAEAVFIVSGPKPSYDLCYELWKVGIHAYSATWDS